MDTVLSILMLAAIALTIGAGYLWAAKGLRTQALLMLLAALVMLANVAIWSLPAPA